jgi:hypothetical protein
LQQRFGPKTFAAAFYFCSLLIFEQFAEKKVCHYAVLWREESAILLVSNSDRSVESVVRSPQQARL